MSKKLLTPGNAALALGGIGVAVYFFPRIQKPIETATTQNIADRFSAGGGSHTHTPGYATPRGKPDQIASPQLKPKGIDTKHFTENVADQKADDQSGAKKAINKAAYGQEKGK